MCANPYDYTRPVVDDAMFHGHEALLEEIVSNFCASSPHSYSLFGGRRFGKTSFMRALERRLMARLTTKVEPLIIPIYLDLQFEAFASRGDFFARVIGYLCEVIQENLPQIALDDEHLGELKVQMTTGRELHSQFDFEQAFASIRSAAFPKVGSLRCLLLIDESERILLQPWASELHTNLRALLSNRPKIRDHLGVVMAGASDFYAKIAEEGSPLDNILRRKLLLPLSREESVALVVEPTGGSLPTEVVDEIERQSGGHPFLIQYLMYHLWELGLADVGVELIQEIADEFVFEGKHFERWCKRIGPLGERTYSLLCDQGDWIRRSDIYRAFPDDRTELKNALEALSYHGLVYEDKQRRFRVGAGMFRAWFEEFRASSTGISPEGKETKIMNYHDFELLITPDRTIHASSGEGEAHGELDLDMNDIQATLERIELRDTTEELLKELGTMLYEALFPGPIEAHLRATETAAREAEAKVRLRLRIEADEVAALPLEFAYRTLGGFFLAQNPDTVLSRYLALPLPPDRVRRRQGSLDLLTIIANPEDLTPLDPDEWEHIVAQALATPIKEGKITLRIAKRATFQGIRDALLDNEPDIIQFVGHGFYQNGTGHLALVDSDTGKTWSVDDRGFANLLMGFDDHLGLVSLATCEGAKSNSPQGFLGIAPKIVQRGVPAVVAMQYKVYVKTAEIFLENLYSSIAARRPVDWAVQWARNAVSINMGLDNREFATPVLYMRAKDGQVF